MRWSRRKRPNLEKGQFWKEDDFFSLMPNQKHVRFGAIPRRLAKSWLLLGSVYAYSDDFLGIHFIRYSERQLSFNISL